MPTLVPRWHTYREETSECEIAQRFAINVQIIRKIPRSTAFIFDGLTLC